MSQGGGAPHESGAPGEAASPGSGFGMMSGLHFEADAKTPE
jgi:hypothetical protein